MGDHRRVDFSLRELQAVYHLPLRAAARRLGVCEAALKRICRRHRILKWPFRQLSSVQRRIDGLQVDSRDENAPPNLLPGRELPTDGVKKRMLEDEWQRIVRSAHLEDQPRPSAGDLTPEWMCPLYMLACASEAEADEHRRQLRLQRELTLGVLPSIISEIALRMLADVAVARSYPDAR